MSLDFNILKEGVNYIESNVSDIHPVFLLRNIDLLPNKTVVSLPTQTIFKYSKDNVKVLKKRYEVDYLVKNYKSMEFFITTRVSSIDVLVEFYLNPPSKKVLYIVNKACSYLKLFNKVSDFILNNTEKPPFVIEHDYTSSKHVGLKSLKSYLEFNKIHILEDTGIPLRGITLMGVPGTGKTYASHLIAKILNLPLYELDLTSVFNSLLGETESNIDSALNFFNHKCVVLLDEVDKFFNSGLKNGHFTHASITSKLLKFMSRNKDVFFVMTANKSEGIPPEFTRKGRIDTHFYIDFPCEKELGSYCKYFCSKLKIGNRSKDSITTGIGPLLPVMVSRKFLFTDLDTYLRDFYTAKLSKQENINLELPKSDYEINKDKFTDIIKWSKDNARPAN